MKKRLQIAAALVALAGSAGLYGQIMNVRMNIPFTFQAGETIMPAGPYLIHHSQGVLTLQEQHGKTLAVLTNGTINRDESNKAVLQFNRYGNEYFLVKISTPDSDVARVVSQSRREKELARRIGAPTESIAVAAQTK